MLKKRYITTQYAIDISLKTISQGEVVDAKVISQSIENILMTGNNERVFEPTYGSFLPNMVFRNMTVSYANDVLENIIRLIKKFETRIFIKEQDCRIDVITSSATIEISIPYIITASGTAAEFNKRIVF